MKKYIVTGFLLLALVACTYTPTPSAYTLTEPDIALVDRTVSRVEAGLIGKSESARIDMIASLERYATQQKDDRMQAIVQSVIGHIEKSDIDSLFQDTTTPVSPVGPKRTVLTFADQTIGVILPATYSAQSGSNGDWLLTLLEPDTHDEISITQVFGSRYVNSDNKFGDVTLIYDPNKKIWTASSNSEGPSCPQAPCPVRTFVTTDGVTVFLGSRRWLTYIVPLAPDRLIVLNATGAGYTKPLEDMIQTFQLTK